MTFHPSGIFVPLVTPFTDTGEIAATDLERLAHGVIEEGAAGIVALGTTAEAATLTPLERREVVRICSTACREHGVPLIVGAGSNDTAGTARTLEELHAEGDATAAMVVVPYYTRPSEAGVVAHFEYIAARSPLPLILYNVPYRTGQHLGWESVERLSQHPQIAGIKQAVGSVDTDTARLVAVAPTSFSVLAGDDALVSPLLAMGAAGAILATANVCTREFVELFRLWDGGFLSQARALGNRLVETACALTAGPNPTVIKAVLHAQGRISTPNVRLPLLPAGSPAAILGALPHTVRAG
ncbi:MULTISPECIES: 4-hydroxy-tetrahydrodipicolinate synthase [unclassified Rhodococcus (in: high G+C Gram-positive bacteria)]|uniref:4-hydroxy-tetrahydrodipicolinate synthase n=1 Tax=unclassified Rhodococcus (in: high G+C Gram-positive bacteria) TaxID=192944 RepID=UPI00146A2C5B|nr:MULTISPECIES: 4-hydroxy-tetrahydrodipicolinate synthase [unclassified Rhodococcus (in: high G+C Gram-positive bacteria)]NMD94321.1 4-hydroxy-tetrahydrodipicolinate synthase [Rhodococcus sp. BL-253-APC-6A1W]NME78523.1 4-hydroxy-tetrahydrodipicolinate synthase [Rhodococcus sp. 105337]